MLIPLIRGTEGVNKSIILALSLFITLPAQAQTVSLSASGNCAGTPANCGTAGDRNGDRDPARPGLQVDEGDTVTFIIQANNIPTGATGNVAINTIWSGSAYNTADLRDSLGRTPSVPATVLTLIPIELGDGTNRPTFRVVTDGITEGDETITVRFGSFHAASAPGFTIGTPSSVTVTIRGTPDYDTNNNGLIDITTLAQLNAIRWDLNGDGDVSSGDAANYLLAFPGRDTSATGRMGCQLTDHDDDTSTPNQATCTGYELMNDLDFDTDGDGSTWTESAGGTITGDPDDAYYNSGAGWNPISTFTATFSGNGHTIANLFINRSGTDIIGLFGGISGSARIETLGITAAEVTGRNFVGILVGEASTNTTIVASFTTGQVSGASAVGGLVGSRDSSTLNFTILACYSTAAVSGTQITFSTIGGLVADNSRGTTAASYAIGRVSGTSTSPTRGLIGAWNVATVTASYWDTETSGIPDDSDALQPEGKTTAELQTPTDYTGIYANWNVNVDGVTGIDDPWAFGADYQYPVLRYGRTPAQIRAQFEAQPLRPSSTGADVNEDGRLNAQDALLMYQTYLPALRGTGVVESAIAARATTWQENGRAVGGDLNDDGPINHRDALIMYYAYEFGDLLDQSAVLRQLLLNGVRGRMPDTDAIYRELLRRANRLR